MTGIGQQFEYIMRDESLHLAFGADLIKTIVAENPIIWTADFKAELVELIKKAVHLEKAYAYDACPEGILGINAKQFADYVEYIADRRLERIGLPKVYETENPFPWMSTAIDLPKEKNFFETRVTEYQVGGLSWDWAFLVIPTLGGEEIHPRAGTRQPHFSTPPSFSLTR